MNLLLRNNMAHNSTKSIDVGGVFFMDLSVNDSDFNDDPSATETAQSQAAGNGDNARRGGGGDTRRRAAANHHHQDKSIRLSPTYRSNNDNQYSSLNRNRAATSIADQRSSKATSSMTTRSNKQTTTTTQPPPPPSTDYLGSSLDRLASVINCDGQQDDMAPLINRDHERSLTIVRQQQQPYDFKELQSSCSLSDESYVASGEASLSASLAGSSEQEGDEEDEEEYEDKGSTTTREDSGVLDMKDLEGQLNNGSYDDDKHDHRASTNSTTTTATATASKPPPLEKEKSISKNIMAANLINNSAIGNINFQYQQQENINYNKQQHRSISKPTDGSNNNTNHYHNNHRSNHSKRTVSASLPIQVPTRQMKRNLNRMKLKLMRDEEPASIELIAENNNAAAESSPVRKGDRNRPAIENLAAFDDDDAFLNQEFNANHHNHYPIDELEHLTAEDDPMRLFASIQALARSLHEDSELFGSLPPKSARASNLTGASQNCLLMTNL